jgi:hypothetical protein
MEFELNLVSRRSILNKKHISTEVDIMTAWLTNDVRWVKDEACRIVGDIDAMSYRGGRNVPGGGVRE